MSRITCGASSCSYTATTMATVSACALMSATDGIWCFTPYPPIAFPLIPVTSNNSMRVCDYIFEFIANQGVGHVFFLPGGGAMHLNNALLRQPRLTAVSMLHEQGAAIAAEGYARTSGGFGVCLVTSGPGATNAITGLAGAWFESTPTLCVSGQVKRADLKGDSGLRQLGTQELDIVS